ncbi:site-specific integrase [Streptomyces sp. 21So2-11]|uniref:site-specific integrase n=1 Tax=Streptomyces sp. 21So2-11 TaxID=3144408 RepID=UPI00321A806C
MMPRPQIAVGLPPRSVFAGEDVCLAAGLPVDPAKAGRRPFFDDDTWDFTCVTGLPRHQPVRVQMINFGRIANPVQRQLTKEYLFGLLAPEHRLVRVLPGAYRMPRVISTAHQRMFHIQRWFDWLAERGIHDLGEVTQETCDAYLQWCHHTWNRKNGHAVKETKPDYRRQSVSTLQDLADYGELFGAGGYSHGFRPWGNKSSQLVSGYRNTKGNSTQPVRPEVLQPLLASCFYIIEHLAEPVLALRESERRRAAAWEEAFGDRDEPRAWAPLMSAVVRDYLRRGEPLPATSDEQVQARLKRGWEKDDALLRVSVKRLGYEAGIRFPHVTRLMDEHRDELRDAAELLGVEHPTARNASQVPRADGRGEAPWTLPIPGHTQTDWLIERVRSACLTVVVALTGMRMSELVEIPTGFRLPSQTVAGGLTRHRIRSKRIKGVKHGGEWDEWVVVEEVHKALELLRRLLDDPEEESHLVGGDNLHFGWRMIYLRQWVNGEDGQRLGLTPIPDGQVNLKMLRRTLALELAHRPGGLLAAKVALKHVSVATTEGYAARPGGQQSIFMAEVGKEEQSRNLEVTLQAFRDFQQGILPAGPGARDLAEFFESVDGQLAELAEKAPTVKRGDREVAALLAKRAGTLHLGVANYCWFIDPAKALCLKLAGAPVTKDSKPMAGMCDSARCPQATHHPCHRPVWAESADSGKVFIATIPRGNKAERQRLEAELARSERVVAEIDAAYPATHQEEDGDGPADQ